MIVTFQKSHVKIRGKTINTHILTCDFWNVTIMDDGLVLS